MQRLFAANGCAQGLDKARLRHGRRPLRQGFVCGRLRLESALTKALRLRKKIGRFCDEYET